MSLLRRLLATAAIVLCTATVAACVGVVVGMWTVGRQVSGRVHHAFDRLEVALQRASAANRSVRRVLAQALADVEAQPDGQPAGAPGARGRRESSALRALAQRRVARDIGELRGRLDTLADAAVAAASLLQGTQEIAEDRRGRAEVGRLERWAAEAGQLAVTLQRLEAAVGDGPPAAGGREPAEPAGAVELALQRCQAKLDAWQTDLDAAGAGLQEWEATTAGWLRHAAIALTLLCAWVAAGQVSLFAHAVGWLRRRHGDARRSAAHSPARESRMAGD